MTARWLGVGAALWALATPMVLEFGAVEGTDMPAAALSLAALATAARRPALSGAFLGAAILCRYTALAAAPVALWLTPARGRLLLTLTLTLAPHWGVALWQGRSPLPDQSMNMAIGAGGPGQAPSAVEAFSAPRWARWSLGPPSSAPWVCSSACGAATDAPGP
ncbi:MAG: hypothetical protein IPI35_35040 [Deltaproteobacteria bacterium]|nr:hypothetical protein [Deltaproteobacteria bacterium]